jgi:hypothetical protein
VAWGCSWRTEAGQLADGTFDGGGHRACLVRAGGDQHEVDASPIVANPLGNDVAGHRVDPAEEACVVAAGVIGDGLEPGV